MSWTDYLQQERSYQDRLQTTKLNAMRVTQRPDDTEIRFQTHHEILTLIYILRSDASAGTKQRALEILAAATASTSAKAVRLGEIENVLIDAEDTDELPMQQLERIEDNVYAISVQTRRRLLGFQGNDEDLELQDYHFPQMVLVSPVSLIDLLGEEFELTKGRDTAAREQFEEMWLTKKNQDDDDLTEAELKALSKKEKKALAKKKTEVEFTDSERKTAEILYLFKRAKGLITPGIVQEFSDELPKQFIVNTMLSYVRHHPPDILRLAVSGAGAATMGAEKQEFHDDHLLEHILELPEDRIHGGTDEIEVAALEKIRRLRRMYTSGEIHGLLERIHALPDETLEWHDDIMDGIFVEGERAVLLCHWCIYSLAGLLLR